MHHNFTDIRNQAARIRSAGGWSDIAKLFRELGDALLPIDMLLLKAASIQLAQDSHGLTLDDARSALEAACALDSHGIQSEIELGHFLFAVDGTTEVAFTHFEAALARSESSYLEALCGTAKALRELKCAAAAIDLLQSSSAVQTDTVQQLIAELLVDVS
jgi:tetratricopeptide (TPR) repeat protein